LSNLKIVRILQLLNYQISQLLNIAMDSSSPMRRRSQPTRARRDDGYIMLTLLLAIALMAIFAAAIVPTIAFDIKRDREEEMIHRGVQYSRAIRAYYKKFGRYPVKLEDLENTNRQRFLRKRYKDPLNCKQSKCADFKLLHFGEVQMTLSAMGGGVIPGATPAGTVGSSPTSAFGGSSGSANSNSTFGQTAQTGPDPAQPGSQTSATDTGDASNPSTPGSSTGSNQIGSGQIIGGPIVGVASATTTKDSTIREFNHKKKYKDWAFVYDPAQDQGRLITTPYQPQLATFGQPGTPNLNGQNGQSGSNGQPGSNNGFGNSSFGNSSGFGSSSSGFGNNSNSPSSGGFSQPNPPPSNPPQQQ
jgi:type II secretory pathway pseudopilin PulG